MVKPPVPVHYLRPNDRNWSPKSVIFMDTETRTIHEDRTPCPWRAGDTDEHGRPIPECELPHVETLRLWVATYLDRKPIKKLERRALTGWGRTANELALWINSVTTNRESVWLYCHNLGFDITTTRLPVWLTRHGWAISDASVGGKSPWIRMHRGHRSLAMADSWSWLPTALDTIGQAVKVPKPPLPTQGDDLHVWRARCGWDVCILATAVLELMDWWDDNKLGNWTLTGAACGWNAYRHREEGGTVTINVDPDKVTQDRLAVHGGRRGVWVIGEHRAGPFLELDFTAAYPTIAAWLPHPVGRAYSFDRKDINDPIIESERWGIAAAVRLGTDQPRWPVRVGGATWYGVGSMWAELSGPDIREAHSLGVLREIGPGQAHRLDYNMSSWARWCIRVQNGEEPFTPPVARIVAKSWGRTVIGKWASRSFEREKWGPAPTESWGFEEGWDHDKGSHGNIVDLAGQRWWISSDGVPDNAYPAIFGWVESEVRVRLGRVIDAIGPGAVLQCDTDGLIVAGRTLGTRSAGGTLIAPDGLTGQARWEWVIEQCNLLAAPLILRIKNRPAHVTVLGPQHLTADGQRRFAGLSRQALLGDDGRYHARLWPTLQWQLAHAHPAGYVRPVTAVTITGPFPTGWILRDGRVVPVELLAGEGRTTHLVPWHRTRYAAAGLTRADVQHPTLDGLI